MPIKPHLEWQDAESTLQITVRLPGISQSQGQLDLELTEAFLKVNKSPYLCYVDLFDTVVDSKSSATISSDKIEFCLVKVTSLPWTKPPYAACADTHILQMKLLCKLRSHPWQLCTTGGIQALPSHCYICMPVKRQIRQQQRGRLGKTFDFAVCIDRRPSQADGSSWRQTFQRIK